MNGGRSQSKYVDKNGLVVPKCQNPVNVDIFREIKVIPNWLLQKLFSN